jgi:hypothetical protein
MTRNLSFMSMNAALAPELNLPPHFPCYHNEDGLFAASYLKLNPFGAIGHLPFALRHASVNPPFYSEDDDTYTLGLEDVLVALVDELRPPPGWKAMSSEARLSEFAAYIRNILGSREKIAMELIRDRILSAYAGRKEALERRSEDDSLPDHLRRAMLDAAERRARLIADERLIPKELVTRSNWGDAVVSLGQSYARLLEAWPRMMKTAASLE